MIIIGFGIFLVLLLVVIKYDILEYHFLALNDKQSFSILETVVFNADVSSYKLRSVR